MRIHFGRYAMRGGRQDSTARVVGGVDLRGRDGRMNWTKLRREIEEAMREVEKDSGNPGMVQRLEIQIQKGVRG
jgi:hypothetical protein